MSPNDLIAIKVVLYYLYYYNWLVFALLLHCQHQVWFKKNLEMLSHIIESAWFPGTWTWCYAVGQCPHYLNRWCYFRGCEGRRHCWAVSGRSDDLVHRESPRYSGDARARSHEGRFLRQVCDTFHTLHLIPTFMCGVDVHYICLHFDWSYTSSPDSLFSLISPSFYPTIIPSSSSFVLPFISPSFVRSAPLFTSHAHTTSTSFPGLSFPSIFTFCHTTLQFFHTLCSLWVTSATHWT